MTGAMMSGLAAMMASGMVDPRMEHARKSLQRPLDAPYVVFPSPEDFDRVYPRFDMKHPMPDHKRRNIEAFVDMRQPRDRRVIYVNPESAPYKAGDRDRLAAMLAHENEHVSGKSERDAYLVTLRELERMGRGNDPFARRVRAMLGMAEVMGKR